MTTSVSKKDTDVPDNVCSETAVSSTLEICPADASDQQSKLGAAVAASASEGSNGSRKRKLDDKDCEMNDEKREYEIEACALRAYERACLYLTWRDTKVVGEIIVQIERMNALFKGYKRDLYKNENAVVLLIPNALNELRGHVNHKVNIECGVPDLTMMVKEISHTLLPYAM